MVQPVVPVNFNADVRVERDDYKKVTNFRAINAAANRFETLMLRAWRHDGGELIYQIYVTDYYSTGSWRFYEEAHDRSGHRFDVTLIGREVGSCSAYSGCSHFETVGLNIERAYLERHQESGIDFRVSGRAGTADFFLPPEYVQSFLRQVN